MQYFFLNVFVDYLKLSPAKPIKGKDLFLFNC